MNSIGKLMIYSIISGIITVILLIICKKYIKEKETKDKVFKITAILVVLIHYSSLWVDYLTTGSASVAGSMLFTIYPCNIIMWLLVVVAFNKNRKSKLYVYISHFCFFIGSCCGVIGVVVNENFLSNPSFSDYDILKGLLSHSVMIFGCIYIQVMNYIEINALDTIRGTTIGFLLFLIVGIVINSLFKAFGLDSVNSMYLQENPFPNLPFINTVFIGVVGIIVTFILTTILECISFDKENRWYYKVKKYVDEIKQSN